VENPSMAYNNQRTKKSVQAILKEEELVHQLRDPMEIEYWETLMLFLFICEYWEYVEI